VPSTVYLLFVLLMWRMPLVSVLCSLEYPFFLISYGSYLLALLFREHAYVRLFFAWIMDIPCILLDASDLFCLVYAPPMAILHIPLSHGDLAVEVLLSTLTARQPLRYSIAFLDNPSAPTLYVCQTPSGGTFFRLGHFLRCRTIFGCLILITSPSSMTQIFSAEFTLHPWPGPTRGTLSIVSSLYFMLVDCASGALLLA